MKPPASPAARPLRPDRHYGFGIAWARSAVEAPEAREAAEVDLRARMGLRVTGRVQWRTARGADARELLTLLAQDHDANTDTVAECRNLIEKYGGWIIVALAEGVREEKDGSQNPSER